MSIATPQEHLYALLYTDTVSRKGSGKYMSQRATRVRLAFQLAGEGCLYQDVIAALNKLEFPRSNRHCLESAAYLPTTDQ